MKPSDPTDDEPQPAGASAENDAPAGSSATEPLATEPLATEPLATEPLEGVPLFPLGTVLFPGGLLPLQIFETRYLDMVKGCMRDDRPFGVVLIQEGRESRRTNDDAAPRVAEVGTLARIIDFTQLNNGLLGITAQGVERFRLLRTREQADRLLVADVMPLAEAGPAPVPDEYASLVEILQQLVEHPAVNRLGIEVDWDDARSVAGRLADLLPVSPQRKQTVLEVDDPLIRLAELERVVHAMQQEADEDR
ncbi:MAG TPA: LON peptidase substrate-binding domain-containing protein [Pseudomonadales bacterium]|nr:LON peptidase substrate-binding domain-containing protein [Pseudomonadales bacterium]